MFCIFVYLRVYELQSDSVPEEWLYVCVWGGGEKSKHRCYNDTISFVYTIPDPMFSSPPRFTSTTLHYFKPEGIMPTAMRRRSSRASIPFTTSWKRPSPPTTTTPSYSLRVAVSRIQMPACCPAMVTVSSNSTLQHRRGDQRER